MEKRNESNGYLPVVEYSAAFLTIALLVYSTVVMYTTDDNVLGASDSTSSSFALPGWFAFVIAAFLIMGVVVLFTVILSSATIKKMKRQN